LDVAAKVEPDADGDGYVDETQDGCPSQAASHGACLPPAAASPDKTAPVSRFTAGPKRTTKSTAKFAFTSDDPGARFECRITGKQVRTIEESTFGPCTSPKKFKHLKPGKYQVSVRAIDAAGNVEADPPTVKLKVEKKKG
jgi:predicted phage tail protein